MNGDSRGLHDLPARTPVSRSRGRHRKPPSPSASPYAPALVLAVRRPHETVREIVALTENECPDVSVRIAYLAGLGDDCLAAVLGDLAGLTPGPTPGPTAVIVPLLTGPSMTVDAAVQRTVEQSPTRAVVTPPLGPHPLLAEALHARLSDLGLARVQHVRVLSVSIAADAVVVATCGGTQAVRAAEVTAVLLASRLAVPVAAAAVPGEPVEPGTPSLSDMVEQMRKSGARRVAVAPYVIGPEVTADEMSRWTAGLDVECSPPIGVHGSVARLVAAQYRAVVRSR